MSGINYIVVGKDIKEYKVKEIRANKPVCFMDKKDNKSLIMQETDRVKFYDDKNINRELEYYTPNNIGILLSINRKNLIKSKEIYEKILSNNEFYKSEENRMLQLEKRSSLIYDYIEHIQSAIVFGYTAIETFCNISIPYEFKYEIINNKGIKEIYEKDSIERWLSLKEKLSKILTKIYETNDIKKDKVWSDFCEFELLRNGIIHQKTIERTEFYKKYFNKKIFEICLIPEEIIKFYFNNKKNNVTNILWPWVINAKNDFIIKNDFDESNFEVTGNIFEDIWH